MDLLANSKTLTATVRMNTTQAEQKLKRLAKAIDAINRAIGKPANTYNQVNAALRKTVAQTNNAKNSTNQWVSAVDRLNNKANTTKSIFSGIGGILKKVAGTLLSIGTVKLAIEGADKLVGAENRLNNIAVAQYGDSAYTKDNSGNITGFSKKAMDFSQASMDKMYAVAQNSRALYSDVMANVSKTMTLAPDAFAGNIDNAIRFQEIMNKAYTIGGASAQERSTSMYQLTQALGSGVLAGDELRSVREGAPLAYQAIEKFAQGVLKSDESLKELASDGKITSDIVVAAIMNMGDEVDQQFALTKWRFSEVWTSIKSSAERAFQPVIKMLSDMLNTAVDNGLLEKAQNIFNALAKGVMIVMKVIQIAIRWISKLVDGISKAVNWIRTNWEWIEPILITGLILVAAYFVWLGAVAVYNAIVSAIAWLTVNWQFLLIIATIAALIYVVLLFRNGTIDACTAITVALLIVGAAIALIAIITGNVTLFIIALVIMVVAIIIKYFEYVMGAIYVVGAFFKNVGLSIANFFIACVKWVSATFQNGIAFVKNLIQALWNVVKGVATNIGIAFTNAWYGAQSAFWNFIADCLSGLKKLEPAINAIAEALGAEGFTLSGVVEDVRGKASTAEGKMKDYVDIGDAWKSGMGTHGYVDASAAFSDGMNTYDTWQDGWANTAFNNGKDFGAGVKDSVNEWASQFQKQEDKATDKTKEKTGLLDGLGEKLGLDFSGMGNFPDADSSKYNPDKAEDLLKGIGDDTGTIADSMDLTAEDLKYLRDVANMEWKKEFTTATIQVDMSNYNTINGENDLDGIVTKLADKLYEEMDYMANGVYAY